MANVCCHPRLAPDQRCQTARRDQRTDDHVSRPANRNCLSAARTFLVPAPQACVRVGRSFRAVSAPSPPMRGGWSADRRTLSFGRACAARPPCPGATGTPLGAPPWRFSDADPRSRLPAVGPEPQRLPAPRHQAWRSGSGPPCGAVRAASAGRHSWLRLSGSFLENAPHERGWQILFYIFVT